MQPILIIMTSHQQLGNTGQLTGIWAEELTTPYYILQDAGYDVVFASPLGGMPPFSPDSVKQPIENNTESVKRFLLDSQAMKKLELTHKTESLNASDFCAVFLPGGHGTMWDLATDLHTARLVSDNFNANKPTAAVCHGPAGLILARRPDGKSILWGKKVNSFTNEEETAAGLMNVVPFHLQTKLMELGGLFENAPMWQAFATRDGNLITGQNPASSAAVAQHLTAALSE